jgi:NAD-dependent SIR2 family protein deacetylase
MECGDLHFGFARVKCQECGHEYLLAYSCKRRHFCPSCHQKRVVEFGEWLCSQVLKLVPTANNLKVRNWARLIQKIYQVDPLLYPKCQGAMNVIAFIEDDTLIKKILMHLGL